MLRVNVQRVSGVARYGWRALIGGGVVLWTPDTRADVPLSRTTRHKLRQLVAECLGTQAFRLFY